MLCSGMVQKYVRSAVFLLRGVQMTVTSVR